MLTIKQDVVNSNIFEAVINDNIHKLIKQVNDSNDKYAIEDLKNLFRRFSVKLDKLDPSILKVYDLKDSDEKRIAEKLYDKAKTIEYACFFLKNDIIYCCFTENKFYPIASKDTTHIYNIKKQFLGDSWGKFSKPTVFKNADEMWAINLQKISARQLKNDRIESRKGMWKNTLEFYNMIKKQNIQRYKDAIAKAKSEKGDIKKYYDKFLDLQSEYNKCLKSVKPDYLFAEENWRLQDLLESANHYIIRIFDDIKKIHDVFQIIEKNKDNNSYISRLTNNLENYEENFNENYRIASNKLNEIKEKINI